MDREGVTVQRWKCVTATRPKLPPALTYGAFRRRTKLIGNLR